MLPFSVDISGSFGAGFSKITLMFRSICVKDVRATLGEIFGLGTWYVDLRE